MKNKITEMKKYTGRIQQQNKWYKGMDQWVGRQSSGNHCCWTEKKEKRIKRNEHSIQDLWGKVKWNNIIGVPEVEERRVENICEDIIT